MIVKERLLVKQALSRSQQIHMDT